MENEYLRVQKQTPANTYQHETSARTRPGEQISRAFAHRRRRVAQRRVQQWQQRARSQQRHAAAAAAAAVVVAARRRHCSVRKVAHRLIDREIFAFTENTNEPHKSNSHQLRRKNTNETQYKLHKNTRTDEGTTQTKIRINFTRALAPPK
jgi:hypothetical protein